MRGYLGGFCTAIVSTLVLLFMCLTSPAFAVPVEYIYDPAGRLIAVIDDQASVAEYRYDEVGNLLAIQEQTPVVQVDFVDFYPQEGTPGTTVIIYGKGFSTVPAENNVRFNGAISSVLSSSSTKIFAIVPDDAATGRISVSSPVGAGLSRDDFLVISPNAEIEVRPAHAFVFDHAARQFIAVANGRNVEGIRWKAEGVEGGNPLHGYISASGLYLPPLQLDAQKSVVIEAEKLDDPSRRSNAVVYFMPSVGSLPVAVSFGGELFRNGMISSSSISVQLGSIQAQGVIYAFPVSISPGHSALTVSMPVSTGIQAQ